MTSFLKVSPVGRKKKPEIIYTDNTEMGTYYHFAVESSDKVNLVSEIKITLKIRNV